MLVALVHKPCVFAGRDRNCRRQMASGARASTTRLPAHQVTLFETAAL